jgi:hypothetical protein
MIHEAMASPPPPKWKMDDSRMPLVQLYVEGADGHTPPDLESLLAIMERLTTRKRRIVVVMDLTHARPDAGRRKRLVDWAKSHWASLRTDVVGLAAVAPGGMQRAIVTSILWFVTAPFPIEVFERQADALAWAEKRVIES